MHALFRPTPLGVRIPALGQYREQRAFVTGRNTVLGTLFASVLVSSFCTSPPVAAADDLISNVEITCEHLRRFRAQQHAG